MRLLTLLFALTLVICVPGASAQAPRRVALIIANAHYAAAGTLNNPVNDAQTVASAAQRAGFQTTIVSDVNLTAFQQALRSFGARASGAEAALVYYAGHGIEGKGQNWLIPTDATLSNENTLGLEAINLDQVIAAISGAQWRIVILDACRNNPFGNSWRSGSRAVTRGLAAVDNAEDTLVIYAAAPGQTASDGAGANSPFASALAARLAEQGLPLQLLGNNVRDDVLAATGGVQRPFVSGSMTGRLYFLVPGAAQSDAAADIAQLRRERDDAARIAVEHLNTATPTRVYPDDSPYANLIPDQLPAGFDIDSARRVLAGDRSSLAGAFVWSTTPEGSSYWSNLNAGSGPLPEEAAMLVRYWVSRYDGGERNR